MDTERLLNELAFKATRSSGPGGQHVNKTSTRVELSWSLKLSKVFTDEQKALLESKLHNRLSKDGVLLLASQNSRSQHKNKEDVIERFVNLLEKSLERPKKRKKTKPSKAAKIKRLSNKRAQSEKKANRRKPDY